MPSADGSDDSERLTALFRENSQAVRSFARRRVGPDDAQEIVAETFLVAWRRITDIPDPPLPWLYRVASLEIANHRRRSEKHARVEMALIDGLSSRSEPGTADHPSDHTDAVRVAFSDLSAADQEILRLAAWEQLTSQEGATVLGCSVATYRVRLHRARTRLAKGSGVWGRKRVAQETSRSDMGHPGIDQSMRNVVDGTEAIG